VAEYLGASRERVELASHRTVRRRGGDVVVVHEVRGRLRDGTARAARVLDVFTVEDGRVVRMRASVDPDGASS